MSLSIVYVLTNPAMPGLVKIGRTSYEEANTRIAQLYSTGVPFPFKLEFACKVENPDEVEQALHLAFGPSRVNARREFFSIEPEQAIAILKLLHVPDATLEVEHAPSPIGTQEINAGAEFAARRPNLNFEEMGIPIGSQLFFTESDASVIVSTPKKVKLNDVDRGALLCTRQWKSERSPCHGGPEFWGKNRVSPAITAHMSATRCYAPPCPSGVVSLVVRRGCDRAAGSEATSGDLGRRRGWLLCVDATR